jgi:hypothetical protein
MDINTLKNIKVTRNRKLNCSRNGMERMRQIHMDAALPYLITLDCILKE